MTRNEFIRSHGADCKNWRWAWSFLNPRERTVIFGVWQDNITDQGQLILDDAWEVRNGRKQPAFAESRKHIQLVSLGHRLLTFTQQGIEDANTGTMSLTAFDPHLRQKRLARKNGRWLAVDIEARP